MFARILCALAVVAFACTSAVAQSPDADAIRHVMKATWDKPDSAVDVGPIAVVGDHAIAGWTQGDMGGRALMRRKGHAWVVVLCTGDQLKQVTALRMAGIADDAARQLTAALAESESKIVPARVAMFSRFEGLVTMDGHGAHQDHHQH